MSSNPSTQDNWRAHDHYHCWQDKKPPCGQRIEHLKCCLCELPNPIILKAQLKVASEERRRTIEEAIAEVQSHLRDLKNPKEAPASPRLYEELARRNQVLNNIISVLSALLLNKHE